tara:strand:- start:1891 stop:2511 length:621 start_codon:yes stop_codon:yes gene_type:complete
MEDKFSNIYKKGLWGKNSEGKGISGTGSKFTPDNVFYVNCIKDIIKEHNIKSVCDIGCGDWEISKHIDWKQLGVNYVGIDIVKDVVEENNNKYSSDNVKFLHDNIVTGSCKDYDLVLIKDVLQHLCDDDVKIVMDKLLIHNKFVFTTNGYKFGRTPEKNNWTERDINNKYSYFPLDIDKQPLNYYNESLIKRVERRYKQMLLFYLS